MELLYIAQALKIPIAEVAVNWTEIEGLIYLIFKIYIPLLCFFLFIHSLLQDQK